MTDRGSLIHNKLSNDTGDYFNHINVTNVEATIGVCYWNIYLTGLTITAQFMFQLSLAVQTNTI